MATVQKDKLGYDTSFTVNRELSWLKFNERVLEEAESNTVPLLERLKFVSIFNSNLDEFFMIRVGSLYDLSLMKETHIDNKTGMPAEEQLHSIFRAIPPLYKRRDKCFQALEEQLRQVDIYNLSVKELEKPEKKFTDHYFHTFVEPVLSPQIVDARHPFPHLPSKSLNIVMSLKGNQEPDLFGIIPVPASVPPVLFLPGNSVRYVLLERIILEYADTLFNMYEVKGKTIISVTRNADINPEDEGFDVDDDYRHRMAKVLKKRSRLAPVRMEVQNDIDSPLLEFLCGRLNLKKDQVFRSKSPLVTSYVFSLADKIPPATLRNLTYPPFEPCPSAMVQKGESMVKQVQRRDLFLSFPYEQLDPFLQLLREAAVDPAVISIKITIYRLGSFSKIIDSLIAAAENQKEVTVLMELRARFDEQNNINWAETLESAGCKVIYGMEYFKVHSKICLITRREKGRIQYITQVGTGNYNEKTTKLYTDFSLMTASEAIGMDASEFFKNMAIANLDGQYEHLLIAPNGLKPGIIRLIDGEIEKARRGEKGKIMMKMNSLTERDVLDKLSEASCAGVEIKLIVRGICCLLPGIPGRTENITVRSIVGRFLEHSRVYSFGDGDDPTVYISSADMMTRNTDRRVEIACPVWDKAIKRRILDFLDVQFRDNINAREMLSNGTYVWGGRGAAEPIDSQTYFIQQAKEAAQRIQAPGDGKRRPFSIVKKIFRRTDHP